MTTVAQLAASGRGRVAHILEIKGYTYVFATIAGWTPTDAWYTGGGYDGVKSWLRPIGIDTEDLQRFIEGELEVPSLDLEILDHDGGMTALLSDLGSRVSSRLASDLTAAATTITMISAVNFSSDYPGRAWLGLESITYTGKNATQLTGVTRGALNTTARAYEADDTVEPPVGIMVTDGPIDIRGRPCRVHEAVVDDDGTVGATTVIYRGFIGTELDIGEGVWRIPIEHKSIVFERMVGQGLTSSPALRGYWYAGSVDPGLSTIFTYDPGVGTPHSITIDPGMYGSPEALRVELNSKLDSEWSGTGIDPVIVYTFIDSTTPEWAIYAQAGGANTFTVDVREGDPLWALGFDPGHYEQDFNMDWLKPAQNPPRYLVVDFSAPETSVNHPRIYVEDSSKFAQGLAVSLPGKSWALVNSTSTSPDTVFLRLGTVDPARREMFWGVTADDADDAVLSHVFAIGPQPGSPDNIVDAAQRMLYLKSGQSEPEKWCAIGLESEDVDWTSLTSAITGAPIQLTMWHDAVTDPASVADLLFPRLGLLGVAPIINAAGQIAFAREGTPIALEASSVQVNEDVWSGLDAARVRATLGGDPLITQALIRFGYDYRTDEWARDMEITWDDGIASIGRVRAITYDLRGLIVHPTMPGVCSDRGELRSILVQWTTALQYGLYGRLSSRVELPCTWVSRQLVGGDKVLVTHELIPDIRRGTIGVTSQIATVTGRRNPHTSNDPDVLHLRFPPQINASGFAPGAIGDSWTVGSLRMGFSTCDKPEFAAIGGNDLDDFTAGDDVLLWEYNTETPTGSYPLSATIATISPAGKDVTFTADPFSGAGLPASGMVWMTFCDWDDMTAAQQLWLAIADTDYELGTARDDGFRWGV